MISNFKYHIISLEGARNLGPGGSQRCLVNHQKRTIYRRISRKQKGNFPALPSKGSSAKLGRCFQQEGANIRSLSMTRFCYRYRMHILGMHLKASPKSNANQIWPSSHTQTHPHTHPEDTEDNASTKNL